MPRPASPDFTDLHRSSPEALAVYLSEYADWGNACMRALHTQWWPLHLERCAECRAVQARWDAEQREAA